MSKILDLLELIDDWKIRLLQLCKNYEHLSYHVFLMSLIPCILNTLRCNCLRRMEYDSIETATLEGNNITKNVGEVEGTVFDEAVAFLRRSDF